MKQTSKTRFVLLILASACSAAAEQANQPSIAPESAATRPTDPGAAAKKADSLLARKTVESLAVIPRTGDSTKLPAAKPIATPTAPVTGGRIDAGEPIRGLYVNRFAAQSMR